MTHLIARLQKDESGATAIEYGLIAALICVAIIGGLSSLGSNMDTMYTTISSAIK
jgi:pilus assembly protein Flp/PilA